MQAGRNILHVGVSTSIHRVIDEFKLGCVRVQAIELPCVEYEVLLLGLQMQFKLFA